MVPEAFATITTVQLLEMFEIEQPNNEHRDKGYALINVLTPETFEKEHIPGSINIPLGHEDEFEQGFTKDKEIIVYGNSLACDASQHMSRSNWSSVAFTASRTTRKASGMEGRRQPMHGTGLQLSQ
jgi:phosphoketolase